MRLVRVGGGRGVTSPPYPPRAWPSRPRPPNPDSRPAAPGVGRQRLDRFDMEHRAGGAAAGYQPPRELVVPAAPQGSHLVPPDGQRDAAAVGVGFVGAGVAEVPGVVRAPAGLAA